MPDLKENEQPTGQDVDLMAAKIIARKQGTEMPIEKPKEQPEGQVPEVKEEASESYDILEDELTSLQELGYSEEDLNEFSREDVDAILETKTKKPEAPQAVQEPTDVIITPEMAAKYGGIAKSFIGKSIGELFAAMNNNNSYVSKVTTELNNLKKQLTTKEQSKVEELEKELKTSDALTEEEFWAKYNELVDLKVEAKLRAAQPDPSTATKEAEFFQHVQEVIPEGMKAEEIAEEWWKSLNPQSQEVYAKTSPIIVADAIKAYAALKVKDTVVQKKDAEIETKEKEKSKEARIIGAQLAKQALQKSKDKPTSGTKFNVVPRVQKEASYGDPVADAIMKRKSEY